MLRSEEYAREFLNILRKDGNRTNMYENVDGYLKDRDRQTIYMHQFFMYRNYSDQRNRFTLAYLLVMEAVLDRRHVVALGSKHLLLPDRTVSHLHVEE